MKKQTFMKFHPLIVNAIMRRANVICKIAGDQDFTIYGYIVAENVPTAAVVHYVYVRPEFQRLGIARALFQAIGVIGAFEVSHWTPVLNEIYPKHKLFDFNPYKM
jgi:ribosomal protein S18 acetylase RimI-like enzyme